MNRKKETWHAKDRFMAKTNNDIGKFTTGYIEDQYKQKIAGDRSSLTPDSNYGVMSTATQNNNNSNKGGDKVARATDGEETKKNKKNNASTKCRYYHDSTPCKKAKKDRPFMLLLETDRSG